MRRKVIKCNEMMNVLGYSHIRNLFASSIAKLSTFQYGETLVSLDKKRRKRLFKLSINGMIENDLGRVSHGDIEGQSPNEIFRTNNKLSGTIKRPNLNEFVTLLRRRANIMYPKDIWTAIGMMDIGTGSTVIEAGTGSGALTLYLSRAVGQCGRVISFDVRKDHLDNAIANCAEWDNCLRYRGEQQLLDNIEFHNNDIKDAEGIVNKQVDAACLDMVEPTNTIETVSQLTKTNGIIVVYLPNISQVMQLSKHIWTCGTPIYWDSVIEVINREWTVMPTKFKNTKTMLSFGSNETDDHNTLQVNSSCPERQVVNDSPSNSAANQKKDERYIARPSHNQNPHTAFLVKLRKL